MSSVPLALVVGAVCCFVGAYIGSLVAFVLGRHVFRGWGLILSRRYPVFRAVDVLAQREGTKFIFLLRLVLFVPFNVSNPILGAGSSVSLRCFALGGFGLFPSCLFYVYLGTGIATI